MKPKHKSVQIEIIADYDTSPWDGDWLGKWYGVEWGQEGRPDGGYYKVSRAGLREGAVWLKPSPDAPRPRDCVDIARAWFRDEWGYVRIVVEQTITLTDDAGAEYTREIGDSLWGIECGCARRSRPENDWPELDHEDGRAYLAEIAADLRGEVERQTGVPIPEDEWAIAVKDAVENGPTF